MRGMSRFYSERLAIVVHYVLLTLQNHAVMLPKLIASVRAILLDKWYWWAAEQELFVCANRIESVNISPGAGDVPIGDSPHDED